MEGFFADPLYGGNKDMAAWKMVGFPGARYDYRDHIDKHNVPYPRGPGLHLWRAGLIDGAAACPHKDVVIMGLGWTGSILAQELTDAGLNVVAIERGPWRDTATDFNIGYMPDELRYAIRKDLFLQPAQEAMTMRNNAAQTALPMRDYGSFLPGAGVGGAGVHWNGFTWRFWPSDFRAQDPSDPALWRGQHQGSADRRIGASRYDEIEHCYDQFEYLCGISGKAGNLKGQIQRGGNPFEGPRAREYPNPPLKMPYASTLVRRSGEGSGLSSLPAARRQHVAGLMSIRWACAMGECTYCGYCERFGCANYSKASAADHASCRC